MNERIKQLESQCWEARQYGPPWFNSKKFAELIVRECARVAIEKQTENDINNIVSKNPAKDFAYALIKHFGVEE